MWDLDLSTFAFPELNEFTNSKFSFFHYTIFTVTLIGIILAIFSEDSAPGSNKLSWITYEFLPMPITKSGDISKGNMVNRKKANPSIVQILSLAYFDFIAAASQGDLLTLLQAWYRDILIFFEVTSLKNLAQSKRHMMYLLQKKNLQLAIQKDETEYQSYLDMKRYMLKERCWPYFWTVEDVRDKHIKCEGTTALPFSSYSYLDFIRNQEVQDSAIAAVKKFSTGNHGPRMLGGGSSILRKLERATGKFFGREDSLIFSAGYLACMSAPIAVCKEGDLLLYDSRSHASLQSGIKLCGAATMQFPHNNFQFCEELLKQHRHKYRYGWIIIESVYSMDGDIGDLPAAYALAKKYSCEIICDEAHGLGALGKTGRGAEEYFNMPGACSIIVGTYSKSIGGIGGYIVGNNDLVAYLDFHSQGNLFSAPLTAYSAGGALKAFELIDREPWILEKLHEAKKYFRKVLKESEQKWPSDYPAHKKFVVEGHEDTTVIPIVYPNDPDRVLRVAVGLLDEGYMVSPVVYPACPVNSPRLRITVTTHYEKSDIDNFVDALVRVTINTIPRNLRFNTV